MKVICFTFMSIVLERWLMARQMVWGSTGGWLAGKIYAAMLGETSWREFLAEVANTVPDGTAALMVHNVHTGDGHGLFSGRASRAMTHYNSYYARLNPLQPPLAQKPFGEVAFADELMPRRDLVRTEFFNDFLVPHDLIHSAGVKFAQVDGQSFTLAVGGGAAHAEPIRRAMGKLRGMAPHLGRAFGFYGRERTGSGRELRSVLDSLNTSDVRVIVMDGEQRAKVVPGVAQIAPGDDSPWRLTADGRVQFASAAAQKVSQQMLRRGYAGPAAMDFYFRDTKMTLIRPEKCPERLYFEGPSVVVVIAPQRAVPASAAVQRFSELHGLSPGERRALSGIMAGHSVNDVAAEVRLSRETIRSQTKALYAKLGVSSVAGVLRLLLRETTRYPE